MGRFAAEWVEHSRIIKELAPEFNQFIQEKDIHLYTMQEYERAFWIWYQDIRGMEDE